MTRTETDIQGITPIAQMSRRPPPFGVNEMRLSGREWLVAIGIVLACMICVPMLWKKAEPFVTGPDYRIPYALSKDYWLYQRRLQQINRSDKVILIGDSVVWGEYVRPDGTLSHFLNEESGERDRFVNGGVNGMFPLAMEGLVEHYGRDLWGLKVIVHCNLLWMSSPAADLSAEKEENFNHSRLVPQFYPRIPCYRASANERLSAVIGHHVEFFSWTDHLQNAYYDQHSIPQWTLVEDGREPPGYPNAWRNPLAPLAAGIPDEPLNDPQRGRASARHKPWNADGAEPTDFDWVELDRSLQWHAFGRVIQLLRSRGNDVLVVIGPFNEHMIAEDQRPTYATMREKVATWLSANQIPYIVPDVLPSEFYADASHPLTDGYELLAKQVGSDKTFRAWLDPAKPVSQ